MNATILAMVLLAGAVLMLPRVAGSRGWQAAVTPLASIIGSGFLVLGPILDASYGGYAPLVMAALCGGAYLYGAAIRFNIRTLAAERNARSPLEERLETLASWSLAFAYVVSVAYYLNLFGAFGVRLTPVDDALHAKLLTSATLILILVVGWTRGFKALEHLEQASVSLKLAIIAGLLLGLMGFFLRKAEAGDLVLNTPELTGWGAVTLAFGLIVTVQGFETSRYLGEEYDPEMRVRSMRHAQWIATAIYMIYIGFLAYAFARGDLALEETAIIDMMEVVAPVLPVLLVAAALAAQFSAAVADTSGSGGLVAELTRHRVSSRQGYAVLVGVGLVLTWTLDVFHIISYASRAFAIYYAIQAAIACRGALRRGAFLSMTLFGGLAVLGVLIVAFGVSVEH